MNGHILRGVRILDFTWILAGPYATRILADFGAEVIKVQSHKTAHGAENNETGYFNTWNRNKRSITLDLDFREAREIIFQLAKKSDVVIENFSPRVMDNWGFNYQELKKVKSDLIMVSLSAMGQTGPWKNFVAYAPTIQALSGMTYLTSVSEDEPSGLGFAYADCIAGLYAALATLAALENRDRTGEGQYIDLSELEALCTLLGPMLIHQAVSQDEIKPRGNHADYLMASPYGCYPCRGEDRFCTIAVFNEKQWLALCATLEHPDWTKEERFATLEKRKKNETELDHFLEQWTRRHPPEYIVGRLQKAGIPAGIVQNAKELAEDPHLAARDFFIALDHPVLGRTLGDRSPIRFQGELKESWKAAPLLGEDNQYVLKDLLGLQEEDISAYIQKGIIY
jgi:crotonobetainyl-CoA:carnitine CoA-transferase CaiB-like acyl-CoA transferase